MYIDEYYPHALADTYCGVKGYIYLVENAPNLNPMSDFPFAFTSDDKVTTLGCEMIPDAHEAIMEAKQQGLILIGMKNCLQINFVGYKRQSKKNIRIPKGNQNTDFFLKRSLGIYLPSDV